MKKITLWSLYILFVVLLVLGGVNRTQAKLTDTSLWDTNPINLLAAPQPAQPEEVSEVHVWTSLAASVIKVDEVSLLMQSDDGAQIEIARGGWRYLQAQGADFRVGDRLALDGFYENGDFEVGRMVSQAAGFSIELRDADGHPMWSGGAGGKK
jgi:hypothetical protein